MLKKVEMFTDGSCLGNPGPGGYAAILRYKQKELVLSKGYYLTTNNRMELLAAIIGLEAMKERCNITLYTDSQYVRNGITRWVYSWKKNNWKNARKQTIKNLDLWLRLDNVTQNQNVEWVWVKGHAGHPENERCDEIAKQAALSPTDNDIGFKELKEGN